MLSIPVSLIHTTGDPIVPSNQSELYAAKAAAHGAGGQLELTTVDRGDVANVQEMPLSLMPEGLLAAFNETQVRDLIAYLMHRGQVGQ